MELERKENALIQARINIEKADKLRIKKQEELKELSRDFKTKKIIESKRNSQPIINSVLASAAEVGRIREEKAIEDKAAIENEGSIETKNKDETTPILKKYKIIKLFK